jgi:hypothetical protein
MQVTDHDLAIDEILGATEGDKTDLDHDGGRSLLAGEGRKRGGKRIARKQAPTKEGKEGGKQKRRSETAVKEFWKGNGGLLLLGSFLGSALALEIGDATFLFNDLVCLLSHVM